MADPLRLEVTEVADLPRVLLAAGLSSAPVLVVVGGAGGMDAATEQSVEVLFGDVVVPLVEQVGAAVVDGGTDSGVMRTTGVVREARRASFPLVGVAAEGTLAGPGTSGGDVAEVDPRHTHLVVVPGDSWGDEAPWLAAVAGALAVGHGSATLLVNGGEVAWEDVRHSLADGRPVVVLDGTGRTADAIAAARAVGGHPDAGDGDRAGEVEERAALVVGSPLVHVVHVDDREALVALLGALLADPGTAGVTALR